MDKKTRERVERIQAMEKRLDRCVEATARLSGDCVADTRGTNPPDKETQAMKKMKTRKSETTFASDPQEEPQVQTIEELREQNRRLKQELEGQKRKLEKAKSDLKRANKEKRSAEKDARLAHLGEEAYRRLNIEIEKELGISLKKLHFKVIHDMTSLTPLKDSIDPICEWPVEAFELPACLAPLHRQIPNPKLEFQKVEETAMDLTIRCFRLSRDPEGIPRPSCQTTSLPQKRNLIRKLELYRRGYNLRTNLITQHLG